MHIKSFKLLTLSLIIAAGLAACEKPGPAESAGKSIDKTSDEIGKKVSDSASKTGVVLDDTEITTKVKSAIFAEPGLDSLKISVDTVKGVVTLSGSIATAAQADKVKALAGAVAGVKEVVSHLSIIANK